MTILSTSVEQTLTFGERLGRLASPGLCIALEGTLGAGKTHLVRGIARGAGVADEGLVSSPTYVLLNIYPADAARPGGKTVFHLDAYRTHGAEDLDTLGFDELLQQGGLVVMEWASRVADLLPPDRLTVQLEVGDATERTLTLSAGGPQAASVLQRLAQELASARGPVA